MIGITLRVQFRIKTSFFTCNPITTSTNTATLTSKSYSSWIFNAVACIIPSHFNLPLISSKGSDIRSVTISFELISRRICLSSENISHFRCFPWRRHCSFRSLITGKRWSGAGVEKPLTSFVESRCEQFSPRYPSLSLSISIVSRVRCWISERKPSVNQQSNNY